MYARSHFWFTERPFRDRRKPENRLKRATREAEILEERLVEYWLHLGESALEPRAIRRLPLPARKAA